MAASGVTAIAGFAVLAASDIRMLRDFGLVTVLDLAVALIGVMVVLPAALVGPRTASPVSAFGETRTAPSAPGAPASRLVARISRR